MLEIRLLGGFELVLSDGSIPGRLGSKAQGLLALLAVNRGAVVSRGRLAGLLWGERDEELARHSLNQALSTVRAALGPTATGMLQTCPEGVLLAREGLDLDVAAFESAARSHERATLEEACRLYRGEFLETLGIRDPGFEEWLLTERYRLGELAAEAFARLVDLQAAAGDADAAIETARKLVTLTPLDEAAHARLIQLYGAQGRRGLAEAHYARCSKRLQRELGQAPGDELRAALADARRRAAFASIGPIPDQIRAGSAGSHGLPQPARPWTRTRWASAAVVAVALLIGGVAWIVHERSMGEAGAADSYRAAPWDLPAQPSVAVLPFANLTDDPEQEYFVDGITSDITTNLSKFSTLFVSAANSSFRYKGQAVRVRDVARDLGVRYVLEGSVQPIDDTLSINVSLIDATTGQHVWAERYERPNRNVFAVQKEITRNVAAAVGSGRGALERAELERIARTPTENLRAYDLYLRGVAYANRNTKQDNLLARQMFEKAIQADSRYARALAELSLTYLDDIFNGWSQSRQEWMERAERSARRAIEIDPSEPWGFVTLGLLYQLQANNGQALPLLEKAHALNPNDYFVKEALGYAVTFAGSAERGVELLEQAQRLNPDHPPRSLGGAYFFAHRYQDALAAVNAVLSRPGSPGYWLYKAATHAELGQLDEAHAAIAEALKLDPALTLQGEHERRLALGLAPAYAEHLTEALRKAGLPEEPAARREEAGPAN